MTVEPRDPESQATALTSEEFAKVLTAVSEVAGAFGIERDITVDAPGGLKETTGTSEYWSYQLLVRYRRADEGTGYSRVAIKVRRDKDTDGVSVHISDRDGYSYEVFTKDLQAALSSALTSALPSRRIVVRRRSLTGVSSQTHPPL